MKLVYAVVLLAILVALLPASAGAQDVVTIYVEVRPGDTWSTIARRYGTTTSVVRALNPGFGRLFPHSLVEVPVRAKQMECVSSYWPSRLCQFMPEFR